MVQTDVFASPAPSSSKQTESENQSSLLGKRRAPSSKIIGYVESVSPFKRNQRDSTDYCDVVLQIEGPKKRRAVCMLLQCKKATSSGEKEQQNSC